MNLYHKATYNILNSFSGVLKILSDRSRYVISQNMASIFYNYIPKRKDTALKNIKIAFPNKSEAQINQILKNCYQFFTYNFIQFMAFPLKTDSIKIEIIGKDFLDDALKYKKGVILISGHFGAWEIMGHWFGVNGYPLRGVAQKQKNRGANEFFEKKRQLSGTTQVYRKINIDDLYEILHQQKILGLVSDQDAKKKGVFVNFFNKKASTHRGASLFHQKTKAPMLYGVCIQCGFNNYRIEISQVKPKRVTVEEITQNYTLKLENLIKRYPEQYFWFHKRWKTKETK